MKFYKILIVVFASAFILNSCKEDEPKDSTPSVPTTYSFANADYSGQTIRLNQLEEMTNYIKTVNTGSAIDAQSLLSMFSNSNGDGGGKFSFSSDKQLRDKTNELGVSDLITFMSELSEISGTSEVGSSGKAGIVTSGTKQYLFNENGVEYQQLIEKGIMGACFLHQITNVYLGFDKMNVDNENNSEGKNYTAMEHHWDEAFGYLGATIDWPTDVTGERYWAKYSHKSNSEVTNELMDSPNEIIDAFIKGRVAINNKDYDERDKQIDIIIKQLELISATTALHYINASINTFSDDALRNHQLSEAYAFIWDLKFINSQKRVISNSQIDSLLGKLGMDYYNISLDDLNSLRDDISTIYNLEAIKSNF